MLHGDDVPVSGAHTRPEHLIGEVQSIDSKGIAKNSKEHTTITVRLKVGQGVGARDVSRLDSHLRDVEPFPSEDYAVGDLDASRVGGSEQRIRTLPHRPVKIVGSDYLGGLARIEEVDLRKGLR
jgi:hypothetical protein